MGGLLPIWVAASCLAALLSATIGLNGLIGLILLHSSRILIGGGGAAVTFFLLLAIVLRAMHSRILDFFSGDSWWLSITGIATLLRFFERRRSSGLLRRANVALVWEGEPERLRHRLAQIPPPPPNAPATVPGLHPLLEAARQGALDAAEGRIVLKQYYDDLVDRLAALYGMVMDAALSPIAERMTVLATAMQEGERYESASARAAWDEQFGPPGVVRPTRLGNLLLAIDAYPYRRYRMDGILFWPHIEMQADDRLRDAIADYRVQLEMILAHAAVFLGLAVFTALAAPWAGLSVALCSTAAAVFAVLAWLFYKSSIRVAEVLGTTLRAACDLLRHKVLREMGFAIPVDMPAERAQWTEASQLVAFGQGNPIFEP